MSADIWDEVVARDAESRRLAQTEFERPIVLEAGAGTGKTATLVARVVAWLLGPGWKRARADLEAEKARTPLDEELIAARVLAGTVAITFTDAAAGEMAQRVGQTLAEVAAGRRPDWLLPEALAAAGGEAPRRALVLAANLERLAVSTIHAFCRRLLASHPLEAGLHPSFAVDADGTAVERIVREVVGEAAREALGPEPRADWLELAAAGYGPAALAESVEALVAAGLPPEALEAEPLPPGWRKSFLAGLGRAAEALANADAALARGSRVDVARAVADAARATTDLVRAGADESVETFDRRCEELRGLWGERLRRKLAAWAGGEPTASEAAALGDAFPAVGEAAAVLQAQLETLAELQPLRLGRARRVVRELLVTTLHRLRSRGWVTFGELLRRASELVRSKPEVAASWRLGVHQLLVDEFQDTDRLQCEMLRALVLDVPAGSRPGLFLVGDPKQSIYGWRNADLAAYHEFVSRVLAAGGVRAELCVSFRSVPAVLAAVETWVGPHLVERPGLQAGFQRLAPSRQNESRDGFRQGRWAPVEIWISGEDRPSGGGQGGSRSRDATEIEAAALASDLVQLHREAGVRWSEVGVLVRSGSDLDIYLAALRDAGVPFVVERDRSYYQRREVLEVAALIRAVVDPTDHVALVGWLRSPAVGVPDAAWLPLWRRGFPALATALGGRSPSELAKLFEVVEEVARSLPDNLPGLARIAGWEESLKAALVGLAELRSSFRRDSAVRFVERLRESTAVEATAAARFLGRFRVANVRRFFRWLSAVLEDGEVDAHEMLRLLRRAVQEHWEEEEAHPTAAIEDAVRVMTIHRAKGLDFEHVYLLQTHKQARRSGEPANAAWEGGGGWEYRLLDAPTPGWRQVAGQRRQVADAELVRTLYVATTRARRRLVLAGRWPSALAGSSSGSHVALLAARGELPEPGEEGFADTQAGRFVWLERQPVVRAGPAGDGERDTADRLARLQADAQRLASARGEAARRMARPFSMAASAEAHRALEALLAARSAEDEGAVFPASRRPQPAGVATLVGAAVHWVLETLSLDCPLVDALTERLPALAGWIGRHASADSAGAVLGGAHEVLARFAGSPLAGRWEEVRRHVLGREVPLLLPPEGTPAVGFVAGQVDLLVADPNDGRPVVIDFKTDQVDSPDEVSARAEAYASQCATYARGVQAALGLAHTPRWELWFLRAGVAVAGAVDAADSS